MKLLFFDCETSGLPKDYKASYTDVDNWPRVISLAWLVSDMNGEVSTREHHLIRPDGWEVPSEKFWTDNGFSQERNQAEGVPIAEVLEKFMASKMECDVLVAHNLNFDHRVVWAEIIRSGRLPKSGMTKICTMMTSTKYCAIPQAKGRGFKWPKLEELHKALFATGFEGAHDALADIEATKKCFFELVARGVIAMPQPAASIPE